MAHIFIDDGSPEARDFDSNYVFFDPDDAESIELALAALRRHKRAAPARTEFARRILTRTLAKKRAQRRALAAKRAQPASSTPLHRLMDQLRYLIQTRSEA